MREIKFRAWHLGLNGSYELKYDVAVYHGYLWYMYEPCRDIPIVEGFDKKAILMQYTGLKDKNGVEIYEGDIVMSNDGFSKRICTVEWRYGGFAAYTQGSSIPWSLCAENGIEVIGNIYENPELLKLLKQHG